MGWISVCLQAGGGSKKEKRTGQTAVFGSGDSVESQLGGFGYVNWSHSKEYVILALADREVGVDVQEMKTEPKQSLIQRTLQPEELIVYDSAPQEQQKRLFYQYWTVKESYLKALGTGFYTPLDTFYVGMDELCPQIVQRIRERDYSCQLLVMPNKDYAAALCVEGEASLRLHPVTVELL